MGVGVGTGTGAGDETHFGSERPPQAANRIINKIIYSKNEPKKKTSV